MKNKFKSIGAVISGLALGAVLSVLTDKIFEITGIMKVDPFDSNPAWLIVVIILYRSIFNVLGTYLCARLAPSEPMKHAMILGVTGLVLSMTGTIAMWDIPPHWYPITLMILTLPSAWLGGKLAINKQTKK